MRFGLGAPLVTTLWHWTLVSRAAQESVESLALSLKPTFDEPKLDFIELFDAFDTDF